MRRATPLLLALLAAVLLAMPATAAPLPAHRGPVRAHIGFALKASNGYKAFVEGMGRKVELTFEKKSKGVSELARYSVKGTTTNKQVKARFGSLGRISLRFKPGGADGRGIFKGTIRFRGEGGYVRLHATTVRHYVVEQPLPSAPHRAAGFAAASADPVFAALGAGTQGRGLVAVASHPDEPDLPAFLAIADERRGRVAIERETIVSGAVDTFTFDDNLSTATIRPPAPFAGSATFTRNPGAPATWAGDLTVDFPGHAGVPMTGAGFEAKLRHELPFD